MVNQAMLKNLDAGSPTATTQTMTRVMLAKV